MAYLYFDGDRIGQEAVDDVVEMEGESGQSEQGQQQPEATLQPT